MAAAMGGDWGEAGEGPHAALMLVLVLVLTLVLVLVLVLVQVLHRDDEEWPLALMGHKLPGAEMELSSMWAVTPFTRDNGASAPRPPHYYSHRTRTHAHTHTRTHAHKHTSTHTHTHTRTHAHAHAHAYKHVHVHCPCPPTPASQGHQADTACLPWRHVTPTWRPSSRKQQMYVGHKESAQSFA